jgi:hypothetical protein
MGYIIAPTLAAVTTQPFKVLDGETLPLVSSGLSGAEEITIQFRLDGDDWKTLTATSSKLTASQSEIIIVSRGEYRAVKPTTVGSTYLSKGVL